MDGETPSNNSFHVDRIWDCTSYRKDKIIFSSLFFRFDPVKRHRQLNLYKVGEKHIERIARNLEPGKLGYTSQISEQKLKEVISLKALEGDRLLFRIGKVEKESSSLGQGVEYGICFATSEYSPDHERSEAEEESIEFEANFQDDFADLSLESDNDEENRDIFDGVEGPLLMLPENGHRNPFLDLVIKK